MAFSLPDQNGNISQLNSGDTKGSLYSTFGIDFNDGKIKVSEQQKVYFDTVSEATLTSKILGGVRFGTDKMLVFSSKIYYFTIGSFFSYSSPSGGNTPSPGAGDTGVFFDSLVLVSDTDDIHSTTDGFSWSLWWTSTLGQSALSNATEAKPRLMKVGANGNLYISDAGNKIYKVTTTGTVTLTGSGTLDFSATNEIFTCMEPTSTRMWIGTSNAAGDASIIEWDMSASSSTPNRIHKIGAEAVRCIIIHEDNPIALLSNGKFKIFNGSQFVDYEGVEIRIPRGTKLTSDFVHRNGWEIIDELPHILLSGKIDSQASDYDAASVSEWSMPSGVYCLDPKKGLYHRFSLGTGDVTRDAYAQVSATDVGALIGLDIEESKFLSGYGTMETDSTYRYTLAYHERTNGITGKAWMATSFYLSLKDPLTSLEMFHKPLEAGCSINVYHRPENTPPIVLQGTWADAHTFNILGTDLGLSVGNLCLIKMGKGAGQWVKITELSESSTVTSVTLATDNTYANAGDAGTLEAFDFVFMGTIDDTTRDYHSLTVPSSEAKRKRQFLLEFTQAANTAIDVDLINISQ